MVLSFWSKRKVAAIFSGMISVSIFSPLKYIGEVLVLATKDLISDLDACSRAKVLDEADTYTPS